MARITVEDCLDRVDNRFDLVLLASHRARQLSLGSEDPILGWENDKPTVVALREIAAGLVDRSIFDKKSEPEAPVEHVSTDFSMGPGIID